MNTYTSSGKDFDEPKNGMKEHLHNLFYHHKFCGKCHKRKYSLNNKPAQENRNISGIKKNYGCKKEYNQL